jgi:CubicO group peptidase (beta-lactamase class C family)
MKFLNASSWMVAVLFCDEWLKTEMAKENIPGLSLAVVKDGKPVKVQGYGLANVELNVPVMPETVFEIGSVTKQFTASLILLLAEDGKLTLEDRVQQHLHGLPASWPAITLRHLLTHTSGITNYNSLGGFEVTRRLKANSFIREISKYRLMFKPGEAWSYGNSAFSLLGYVVEKVSGKPYWEVIAERIFRPVGMASSRSRDQGAIITNRASGYEFEGGKVVNRDSDLTDVFSAGAIVSTVPDLMKWVAALEADKVMSRASRDEMWKPVRLNNGSTVAYGLGWRLEDYAGHKQIGHSGSTAGFSASLQRFPDDKLTVIVLCNLGKQGIATKLGRGVADHYFGRALPDGRGSVEGTKGGNK